MDDMPTSDVVGSAEPTQATGPDSKRRIIETTLSLIEDQGVLGLRLADVAKRAGVSVPLIHKYFLSRDNLIAESLGGFIDEVNNQVNAEMVALSLRFQGRATAGDTARAMPMPNHEWRRRNRILRTEAFAASNHIPLLRERLGAAMRASLARGEQLVLQTRRASGNTSPIPAMQIAWAVTVWADGFLYGDLDSIDLDDDAYAAMLEQFLHQHLF